MNVICFRTWLRLSLSLFIFACQSGTPKATNSAANKDQPKAVEVPQIHVSPVDVQPFPLHPLGLSFQMGDFELPNAVSHKPIGNGMITEDHHVLFTFPTRSQVVKFQAPEFDTIFWGPKSTGGNGTPLEHPLLIRQFDGNFFVSEQKTGQVWQLDSSGNVQNVWDLKTSPIALGPKGFGVLYAPQDPSLFIRVDGKGARDQGYYAAPVLEALGRKTSERGLFYVQNDWQSIFVSQQADLLLHFQPDARLVRVLHLHLDALPLSGNGWSLADCKLKNEQYWVLVTDNAQSLLLRMRMDGQIQDVWRLPFKADGFDFSSQLFLLYQRREGQAQTYRVQ